MIKARLKAKIGKYRCRASFTIVGLTKSAVEDMNKILAREEGKK